jgi:hypothetical protein
MHGLLNRKIMLPQLRRIFWRLVSSAPFPGSLGTPLRLFILTGILLAPLLALAETHNHPEDDFGKHIEYLSSFESRATGTPGARTTAAFIKTKFNELGLASIGSHWFSVPVVRHGKTSLTVVGQNISLPIRPIKANAITPQKIPAPGLEGPLVYVGDGDLLDFNGKIVDGAIILMELNSGKNWLHAANLGAKALIYVDRGLSTKAFLEEKNELSPIQFPRFWSPISDVHEYLGPLASAPNGMVAARVRLSSEAQWREADGENIYGLIPGSDPRLQEQLIIVEAFYDSSDLVSGLSAWG